MGALVSRHPKLVELTLNTPEFDNITHVFRNLSLKLRLMAG